MRSFFNANLAGRRCIAFGDTITVGMDPSAAALDAYDRVFAKMRQVNR